MNIYEVLFTISVPILGIGLTAQAAIKQYYKQREYELVLERYLSGSIDLLAASLEEQTQYYKYNWTRALAVVKALRDFKDEFDINNVDINLKNIEVSKFNIIAQYRLGEIVGSQTMWQVYQLAFAFLYKANTFIIDDLFIMLKTRQGQIFTKKERDEIVSMATKVLKENDAEFNKYIVFLQHFHSIGKLIVNQKITFKKISEMKDNDMIKSINSSLREQFKDELIADK